MGVFGEWQPQYAEAGLVTFPVDISRKAPAVGNYLKAGLPASNHWATKFADATALGIVCGKRNRLTVLDIDEPCENLLADALARFGPSPLIARTASGKYHAYYRHNGEKRKIRGVIEGRGVDLLGAGGMAIAPPSSGENGSYEFIQGSLADFGNLPAMQGLVSEPVTISPGGEVLAANGQRNDTLFKMCLRQARSVHDSAALCSFALSVNASGAWEPLPVDEVLRTASGAWEKQATGTNWVGSEPKVILQASEIDSFLPADGVGNGAALDAMSLFILLRRLHYGKPSFFCANEFRRRFGWSLPKFQLARKYLIDSGRLSMVRHASRDNGAALYRFS